MNATAALPSSSGKLAGKFVRVPLFRRLRCAVRCLAATALIVQGCRSDVPATTKGSASAPGSIQSMPAAPPTDDAAFPYRIPSTLHETDLAHRTSADGGLAVLAPIALRDDSRVPADTLTARDATGVTLDVEWKANDWPAPSNALETDRDRLNELRNATRWSMRIDLASSGRMRLLLRNRGYPLEGGTELRARVDLLGHHVVWPNESQYRPLPPGSLRQLLEDGRADVGGLLPVNGKSVGTGRWLEWETDRILVSTVFGHVTLDRASSLTVGVAGRLLCRWLIELINGDPASELCQDDAVPLRAAFEFPSGGKAEFAVSRVLKKQEFSPAAISVPPAGATLNLKELPRGAQLSGLRLSGLRSRATLPDPTKTAAGVGLLATNHTLGLRALLIDGVIAAWLWPGEERSIPELVPGVYSIAWRDFLGMSREAATNVTLPAHVSVGTAP